ncbi:glycosyltransferase [Paenibacillus sp. ISL-20]|uniref:glycosyltransferase family protein n=1 Tax=Paenibacillus sp. ISL-20 TaxID=2819163 RepID=UPI001BE7CE2B|nr:glycosyltransferase [Paenibacillus sp. ISL-20]MBT2759847.1 glycosyltransferase [Paenibacillus sp. ISL-20]
MKKKVLLYPPTLDWDFLKQRPQQIVNQFARNGWTVVFCNNTQSNLPPEEVEPNVFVYHNFKEVLNLIKHKKIKVDIFYYTWAKCAEFIDQVRAKINIYDSVDSFAQWYEYEDNAVDRAEILLTSSQFLYDLRSKKHSNTHLIRNACPESYIHRDSEIPKEYANLPGPIVMFSGAIGSWVSTRLIKKVADKYTTVFVGKEFGKQCPSNVYNLGTKNHDQLYNYYANADVCLLPFDTTQEVTQAACAIKLFEHMAAGKVTVATKWSETDIYPDAVLAAENEDEFLRMVDLAVTQNLSKKNKDAILEYAKENTWENRFIEIHNIINNYCKQSGVKID